jgi:zinc-ribbon domain
MMAAANSKRKRRRSATAQAERGSSLSPKQEQRPPGASAPSLQSWHLFVLLTLAAASAGAVVVRGSTPANVVFICLAIGTAGVAAFAFHRMLWPLVSVDETGAPEMVGGRTRAALEREKTLVLKAIKELEFDRAMGKVSEADWRDMTSRLRGRALRLIRQLDEGSAAYRELIERELNARRQAAGLAVVPQAPPAVPGPGGASPPAAHGETANAPVGSCGRCGTANDQDARFCKKCGAGLAVGAR